MKFHKNPTRRKKHGFRYSRYTSLCREWAVEKSEWLGESYLPIIWRALKYNRRAGHFQIVSKHRKRAAAERSVAKMAKSLMQPKT